MALKLDKTNLVRNLAKKTKFVVHLDRAISEKEYSWVAKFRTKRGDDAWHPSSDCIPSIYDLWLKASGKGEEKDWSGMRKYGPVGHFWHQYLQFITLEVLEFCEPAAIERAGVRQWGDSPFHYVKGSADVAPVILPGHGEFLVDFKTMGSHDYKRQRVPEWCAGKYEAQLNIYMDFFELDRALIVCVNKDTPHDFKEYEYRRNQPLIDAVYKKWKLVSMCLDEDVEPPENENIELPFEGPCES